MEKPRPRTEPQDLPGGHWYYTNGRSIDLMAREAGLATVAVRLTERELRAMLADLAPKRAATKPRKRSER